MTLRRATTRDWANFVTPWPWALWTIQSRTHFEGNAGCSAPLSCGPAAARCYIICASLGDQRTSYCPDGGTAPPLSLHSTSSASTTGGLRESNGRQPENAKWKRTPQRERLSPRGRRSRPRVGLNEAVFLWRPQLKWGPSTQMRVLNSNEGNNQGYIWSPCTLKSVEICGEPRSVCSQAVAYHDKAWWSSMDRRVAPELSSCSNLPWLSRMILGALW